MEWTRPRGARAAAALAAAAFLAGCAAAPGPLETASMPPSVWVVIGDAGVRDLRGLFREAVCRRMAAGQRGCDDVLLRLAGEQAAGAAAPAADLGGRYRVVFVPGLFSECFESYARPFADVEAALRGSGFEVDYVRVAGRGSVKKNSEQLAAHFRGLRDDGRRVIVFAYSKGLADVLEFVVGYPDAAARIAAIVGVAGAANGSPSAADLGAIYRDWGAGFPLPGCAEGDGTEVADLRPDVRLEWWRRHGGELRVPVFSIVAAPQPDQVSPIMRPKYLRLARTDPRNDGHLFWHDQIAPRGYLLGYANADHWAIAVPVGRELPAASFLFRDNAPRTALVEAAIEVIDATLERTGRGPGAGGAPQ